MAGAVVENLSNRKLCGIFAALFVVLAAFVLLGAVVSAFRGAFPCNSAYIRYSTRAGPAPSNSMSYLLNECTSDSASSWHYIWPESRCRELPEMADATERVWVAQMPHRRNNRVHEYTPLFQSMLAMIEFKFNTHAPGVKAKLGNLSAYACCASMQTTRV